jgi:hypothetical protein
MWRGSPTAVAQSDPRRRGHARRPLEALVGVAGHEADDVTASARDPRGVHVHIRVQTGWSLQPV